MVLDRKTTPDSSGKHRSIKHTLLLEKNMVAWRGNIVVSTQSTVLFSVFYTI